MKTNGGFLVTKIKQPGDRIFEKILSEKNIDEKVQNTGDVHPCGQLDSLRKQCSDDLAQSDYAAGVEAHRYDEKVHAQRVEECCENRDQDARPFVLQRFVQHSSCPHFSPH